ncbi:MAG: sulfur carrier protein ThiS [Oscillospiraceae bacterium]|nr:sulfur carrier protein ThiS [Oscillospiraceae bacterium]
MKIQVSGRRMEVEDGLTVMQLMEQQKVETTRHVSVRVNNAFLPLERYECFPLKEGDTVEFLYSSHKEIVNL